MDLSIVVPCYNEEKNIPMVLDGFAKAAPRGLDFELILVDNNSRDGTAVVLKRELAKGKYSFARTVFQKSPGYGLSLKKGLASAKGEFVCWTHGDVQTPPADCFAAYALAVAQRDPKAVLVKGSRYGRPFLDVLFTFGMGVFESLLFQRWFWDINAQPNLFHRSFRSKVLKGVPGDFSFDLHVYHRAHACGLRVLRFPVHFGRRVYGSSSWNSGMVARLKFIRRTLRFSFKLRF